MVSSESTIEHTEAPSAAAPRTQVAELKDINIAILKNELKSHHRIEFDFAAKWGELFCFRKCLCFDRRKDLLKVGQSKVEEEINFLKMIKTYRKCEALLSVNGYSE